MTQEEHMVIYDQSQSKHELAVKSLSSLDEEERKRAIRFIKNSVIGNKTKKHLYLNLSITPSLVKYLSENVYDVDLKIQACIIIGSFALDKRNIHSLFQSYLIQPLFLLLSKIEGLRYCSTPSDESIRLAESSGRALKSLFQQPKKVLKLKKSNVNLKFFFNKEDLNYNLKIIFGFVSKEKFNNLIEFEAVNYNLIEIGCSIFARLIAIEGSINGPLNDFLIENELLFLFFQNFLSFLENNNYPKVQEACLDALGSLFLKDRRFVYALLDCKDADYLEVILVLLKHKRSTMRLLAANLITILVKLAPEKFTEKKEISIAVVLTLIKLFKDQNILHSISPNVTVQEKSLEVFSELIIHREDLQEAAMEADAILKLNELLSTSIQLVDECMGTRYTNKIIENSLNAIASVCSLSESCRKQVIDLKLLEKIVISMQNPKKNIRAASCQCTRSLSRSVKNLRTSLVENDISSNLFHLLDDKNLKVLLTCSATICNIVLDFSPMKQKFLEVGGVKKICEILKNEQMNYNFNLKLNLIWCLKNLICHAESSLKFKVVEELGFRVLERLLYDEEVEIREQALSFLRNLVCGKADDIENTFSGFGEQSLIAAMEVKLFETKVKNLQQVLFTLVNIATGTEKHKLSLVNSDSIIPQVVNYLSHENSKVKLGAIWIITNLTWKEEDNGSNVSSAEDTRRLIFKLLKQKNLNIKEKLQVLLNDSNFDVRDRVKTCLLNFTEAEERIEADVVMTDIEYLNP
ncbi:Armadillo repeat-containing protein 8 [Lobulomyces angularis]|nr:Armadillo repeat-containing protein 8 [Lobulomyces angularis]